MQKTWDTPTLYRLWNDDTLRTIDVARELGVTQPTLYAIADRHKLGRRRGPTMQPGQKSVEPPAPSEADELLSGESLRFSPWVAARIKELGLGVRRWHQD